jgi:hypothetical protein
MNPRRKHQIAVTIVWIVGALAFFWLVQALLLRPVAPKDEGSVFVPWEREG